MPYAGPELLLFASAGIIVAFIYGRRILGEAEALHRPNRIRVVTVILLCWNGLAWLGFSVGLAQSMDLGDYSNPSDMPHVAEPGAAIFVSTAVAWTIPFLISAARRRSRSWALLAVAAASVAALLVWDLYAHPVFRGGE
jgi:hypothetical protein